MQNCTNTAKTSQYRFVFFRLSPGNQTPDFGAETPGITADINRLYYNNAQWTLANDDDKPLPNVLNIDNYIEKGLKNIYANGKGDSKWSPTVNKEFFTIANTILQESISEVEREAGANFVRENKEFLRQLRYNTGVFAAFKAHDQSKRVAKKLYDENGKLRTFSKFKKATEGITTHHNKLWLRTEYNTAVRSARMGANWQRFEKTKHLYPNLEYMPSRSATPREAHRALWGTIRPIDDPFWATYMPPSAWNCKCSVRATRKQPTDIPADAPDIPPEFQFNPGKTAKTFRTEKHPYYSNTDIKTAVEVGKWWDKEYLKEVIIRNKEYRNSIDAYKGKVIEKPQTATGTLTILRRSIKDIEKHSMNPHVRAYAATMESDIKNWDYLGYSNVSVEKHNESAYFLYYETSIKGEKHYINIKVHKNYKAEVPYAILKSINLKGIKQGLPDDIEKYIKK